MTLATVAEIAAYDLRRFGGEAIDRPTAEKLLNLWHGYDSLTMAERTAILDQFPQPAEPEPVAYRDFLPEDMGERPELVLPAWMTS